MIRSFINLTATCTFGLILLAIAVLVYNGAAHTISALPGDVWNYGRHAGSTTTPVPTFAAGADVLARTPAPTVSTTATTPPATPTAAAATTRLATPFVPKQPLPRKPRRR